jgi:predicted  nucleic acid-binding Zn-ribbon protein
MWLVLVAVAALAAQIDRLTKQILTALETRMSDLDASVADLRSAVAELADRIDTDALNAALADVARLTDELAAAHADDATEQAEIDRLTSELSEAVTEAQENATSITEGAGQVRGLGQPAEPV